MVEPFFGKVFATETFPSTIGAGKVFAVGGKVSWRGAAGARQPGKVLGSGMVRPGKVFSRRARTATRGKVFALDMNHDVSNETLISTADGVLHLRLGNPRDKNFTS